MFGKISLRGESHWDGSSDCCAVSMLCYAMHATAVKKEGENGYQENSFFQKDVGPCSFILLHFLRSFRFGETLGSEFLVYR